MAQAQGPTPQGPHQAPGPGPRLQDPRFQAQVEVSAAVAKPIESRRSAEGTREAVSDHQLPKLRLTRKHLLFCVALPWGSATASPKTPPCAALGAENGKRRCPQTLAEFRRSAAGDGAKVLRMATFGAPLPPTLLAPLPPTPRNLRCGLPKPLFPKVPDRSRSAALPLRRGWRSHMD